MLTAEQRVLFARHRLLPEIGDAGQRALLGASAGDALADRGAEWVRALYLERAGVPLATTGVAPCDVPTFAGASYLEEAARACLGAFAAVEHIKAVVGAGSPAPLPRTPRLSETD